MYNNNTNDNSIKGYYNENILYNLDTINDFNNSLSIYKGNKYIIYIVFFKKNSFFYFF